MNIEPLQPAILSTKEAWAYCGGRSNFEAMAAKAGPLLTPWRRTATQGKTYYLLDTIKQCLNVIQMSRDLIES